MDITGRQPVLNYYARNLKNLRQNLLERCRTLCELVLSEAEMSWTDIDKILLVGGSTRMPMVQEMIRSISGKEINPHEVNPDEVVALGAAIQGTLRQITDDTVETPEMPEAVIERFIGPDGVPKVTVTDGATHNLGLVVLNSDRDYIIHVMIPKMTAVPCEIADQFLTVDENQPTVLIEVVQGLEQDQLRDQIPFFDEYQAGRMHT